MKINASDFQPDSFDIDDSGLKHPRFGAASIWAQWAPLRAGQPCPSVSAWLMTVGLARSVVSHNE